jgi:hypothetical protein
MPGLARNHLTWSQATIEPGADRAHLAASVRGAASRCGRIGPVGPRRAAHGSCQHDTVADLQDNGPGRRPGQVPGSAPAVNVAPADPRQLRAEVSRMRTG